MPVKPARQSFSREEILDILHRNVALYKEEHGFVEFFATLSLYLVQHQEGEDFGIAPSAWSDSLPSGMSLDEIPRPDFAGSQAPPPAYSSDMDEEDAPLELPPTVAELKQRKSGSTNPLPPSIGRGTPPPPPPPAGQRLSTEEQRMISGTFRTPAAYGEDPGPPPNAPPAYQPPKKRSSIEVEGTSLTSSGDTKEVRRLTPQEIRHPNRNQAAQSPDQGQGPGSEQAPVPSQAPANAPAPPPQRPAEQPPPQPPGRGMIQRNVGKARVYKVSRTYKSSTAAETPCHVCGTMIPMGKKHCPGCGTPVQNA